MADIKCPVAVNLRLEIKVCPFAAAKLKYLATNTGLTAQDERSKKKGEGSNMAT